MSEKMQSERDLEALRELTARDIPELETTIHAIRRRGAEAGPRPWNSRRFFMALVHSFRTRPVVATALVVAAVVLVGLIAPVSYDRVVGQDVALAVAGKEMSPQEVSTVAQGLKGALGASHVMAEAISEGAQPCVVFHATLPRRSGADVRRSAAEFARTLAAAGRSASVQVTPRRERVRYPAVAYALDQMIRISVDGKVASQLEAEIRAALVQAGVPDAQVSVTDLPGGGREVKMTVERTQQGGTPPVAPEPVPQIVLTKNGAPITPGEGISVKIQKKVINGATTLALEVVAKGRTAKFEVPNSDSMSDTALSQTISAHLKQAGIDAQVTVAAWKISIDSVK